MGGGFLPNSTDKPAHPQKINGCPEYRKIAIKTFYFFFLSPFYFFDLEIGGDGK